MAAAVTPADFLATLVADGCLSIAKGQLPAKTSIQGKALEKDEQERFGIRPGAVAVRYPVGKTDVYLHLEGARASVWYEGAKADGVVLPLDKALRNAHPTTTMVREITHPDDRGMMVRLYRVGLDAGRYIAVEASYPIGPHIAQKCVVRLHAWERT